MDIPSEISENCLNKLAKNQQREREVRELLEYIYIYIYTQKSIFLLFCGSWISSFLIRDLLDV